MLKPEKEDTEDDNNEGKEEEKEDGEEQKEDKLEYPPEQVEELKSLPVRCRQCQYVIDTDTIFYSWRKRLNDLQVI